MEEVQITLPVVTKEQRHLARQIADARFNLPVNGKRELFQASEITEAILDAESARVARIPNADTRKAEVLAVLKTCLALIQDCQHLASHYLALADELEEGQKRLVNLQGILVTKLAKPGDTSES
jgi:hypothetical protein